MDLSEAISPQLNRFSEFHVDLNRYVKLSVVALNYLSQFSDDSKDLSDLIAGLIKDAGERWYPTNYTSPHNEIITLKAQLTESAIMRVYSSFEVFLDEVSGSYSTYKINVPHAVDASGYGVTVLKLFAAFGWDVSSVSYLLPVYHFYNVARHCVVHQMGKANKELSELCVSNDFLGAIENWPTVIPGNKLSPPPKVNEDHKLELRPHHAITYSDVCYRIAVEVNRNLMSMVGYEYVVKSVALERVLRRDTLDNPVCRDLYRYLKYILEGEYKVRGADFSLIKAVLEKEGIRRKCFQRYTFLSGKVI